MYEKDIKKVHSGNKIIALSVNNLRKEKCEDCNAIIPFLYHKKKEISVSWQKRALRKLQNLFHVEFGKIVGQFCRFTKIDTEKLHTIFSLL